MSALHGTNYQFTGQTHFYKGKVRDVYTLENGWLVMIASDRISAFDVVLPKAIPYKGQVLNQIANTFLDLTADIVPNWKISTPDPMATLGRRAEPFKVEMVIRGYLTGHAWRTYQSGERTLCGVALPEGMQENQAFDEPIITPTTKADHGQHDEDISREAILEKGIVRQEVYEKLEQYTRQLFARGQEFARSRGLLLVDTKYEFGTTSEGEVILIDEIHTPDSSRYFYADTYEECQEKGLPQKQLSKEFVRQWLIENGFQGKEGQEIPAMTADFVNMVSDRYVELFEKITGEALVKFPSDTLEDRIYINVENALKQLR